MVQHGCFVQKPSVFECTQFFVSHHTVSCHFQALLSKQWYLHLTISSSFTPNETPTKYHTYRTSSIKGGEERLSFSQIRGNLLGQFRVLYITVQPYYKYMYTKSLLSDLNGANLHLTRMEFPIFGGTLLRHTTCISYL